MRRRHMIVAAVAALVLAGCGASADEACQPHGGVASWDGEEGFCNGRDSEGDRIEIEQGEGIGEGVVVDLD